MNRQISTTLSLLAAAALLGACASKVPLDNKAAGAAAAPVAAAQPAAGAHAAAAGSGVPQSQVASVDLTRQGAATNMNGALAPYVFFDFDSFLIRDEFKPDIESHARRLATDRNQRLTVKGHTDERGSREYNLALGQKRADAVARSLVLLGAQPGQIETASYGEERPKRAGDREEDWAQNRRAELRAQAATR